MPINYQNITEKNWFPVAKITKIVGPEKIEETKQSFFRDDDDDPQSWKFIRFKVILKFSLIKKWKRVRESETKVTVDSEWKRKWIWDSKSYFWIFKSLASEVHEWETFSFKLF